MRRILIGIGIVLVAVAFVVAAGGASNSSNGQGTYKIEFDNAFGLVTGADFKVAGVKAGTIKAIDLNQNDLHAVVTVQVTQTGFGQFHSDAFCESRPQSLIGEYFVDCQPGQNGPVLPPGSTIPVTHTQSTIAGDLLQDVMRMPYRERFTLIINELGAAVAGRPADLRAALRRAVPAIDETDNLLNLLANDSKTLQQLTVDSNTVITALANNSANVDRFIVEARNAASDTAAQAAAFQSTWALLPGFLEQLRPALQKLGAAVDANEPVLVNLNAASGNLARLFRDLPPFAHVSLPALVSLGKASVTGKQALQAAGPTITALNHFAGPTPELSQNLAIVLHDLDDRSRAVEADPRSPGGRGFTGLEALLGYVFNQTVAINAFSKGICGSTSCTAGFHMLAVDAFYDSRCSPYATPATIAQNLSSPTVKNYRQCYSMLGPNQPGVNETDPSDPSACVPDPGGAPPGEPGPQTSACKLAAADVAASDKSAAKTPNTKSGKAANSNVTTAAANRAGPKSGPPINLRTTLSGLLSQVQSGGQALQDTTTGSSSGQTQQLLNYLLAP